MISRGNCSLPYSTLLANCNQVLLCFNSEEGQNTWTSSKNMDEESEIFLRYIFTADQVPHIRNELTIQPEAAKASGAHVVKYSEPVLRAETAKALDPEVPKPVDTISLTQHHCTETDKIMSRLQEFIQSKDYSQFAELIESSILINILDIGGQPGFLEMIPALIGGPAIYLIFLNLTLPLNQPYKIPFSRDDSVISPFDSMHTVESTISQILSAISNTSKMTSDMIPTKFDKFRNTKPVASIVGTHLDKVKGPEAISQLEKKHAEIKEVTDKFHQVVVNPAKNESFLAVDNFAGTEESDLNSLRAHVTNLIHGRLDSPIPIRPAWFFLSIILRKEFQLVSFTQCLDISRRLNIQEEELKDALWYLHHIIGSLIYYPNIEDEDKWFEMNIICSPQVIFDSISQVIIATLQMFHSSFPVRECYRKDWIEKGLFSLEAIADASKRAHIENQIPAEKLVKLLKHINLLSEIRVHKPQPGTPSILLFMPAILDRVPIEEIAKPPTPDSNHPEAVFLRFICGYVPTGVFCGLVTRIVSWGPAKILGEKWELKSDQVKQNILSFYIGGLHNVTLILHDTCYEIRVERKSVSITLNDLCSQVLTSILYILKEEYECLEPIIAFQCSCDNHMTGKPKASHLCDFYKVAICKNGGERHEVQLKDSQKVWIGEVHSTVC